MNQILRRYGILFYALGIVVLLGSWEVITLQHFTADLKDYAHDVELRNTYQNSGVTLSRSMQELYPDNADTIFLQGLQEAYTRHDFLTGCMYYMKAYRFDVSHNEDLFYHVIECLERQQAEPETLQQAVTAWRRHYPHSKKELKLRFADSPDLWNPTKVAARALEASGTLHVTGCKRQTDANGLVVLDVYIQVSGPVLEVAPVRQQLLDAGFQPRPAPPRSP